MEDEPTTARSIRGPTAWFTVLIGCNLAIFWTPSARSSGRFSRGTVFPHPPDTASQHCPVVVGREEDFLARRDALGTGIGAARRRRRLLLVRIETVCLEPERPTRHRNFFRGRHLGRQPRYVL